MGLAIVCLLQNICIVLLGFLVQDLYASLDRVNEALIALLDPLQ